LLWLDQPVISVAVLLAGRVLLALGESLVITGTMGWGIALVGPQHGGKVMAWLGIAIYAAMAGGAPLGVAVSKAWGFAGIA
ncbi:MFS transporter, partial [Acinetobacter baumannii]